MQDKVVANKVYLCFCSQTRTLSFIDSINIVMCCLSGRIILSCHFMALDHHLSCPTARCAVHRQPYITVVVGPRYEEQAVLSLGDTAGFPFTCYVINFLPHARYFAVFLIATFKYSRRASLNRTNCMKLLHLLWLQRQFPMFHVIATTLSLIHRSSNANVYLYQSSTYNYGAAKTTASVRIILITFLQLLPVRING